MEICPFRADDGSEFVSSGIVYTGETLEESLLHPPEDMSPDPMVTPGTLVKHLELPGEVISEKAEKVRKIFMNEIDILSASPDQGNSHLRRFRELSGSVMGLTLYTDSSVPIGVRARELMHEALEHLDSNGFDFSDLSTDSLNRILALNVFYAGPVDNAWAQGLWPHQGSYHLLVV